MNKVFNINLGGMVFTIDEVAFEKLNNYINKLKLHFSGTEGANEIISDIEARMAELIKSKLAGNTEIVDEKTVDEVMNVMGDVNQLDDDSQKEQHSEKKETEFRNERKLRRNMSDKVFGGVCSGLADYFAIDPILVRVIFLITFFIYGTGFLFYLILWIIIQPKPESETETQIRQPGKRLFRDVDDKVLGGVCSGIGNYIGVDPVWVRIFFAVSFFAFSVGFWIYIALWIAVPKAITAAQKLQMKGDPVDVSNIEREVKSAFSNAKQNAPKVANEMKGFFSRSGDSIAEVAGALARVFGKLIALCLFVIGIFGLTVLGIAYLGIGKSLWFGFVNMAIDNETIYSTLKYGILISVIVPLLSFIITAIRLLFNLKFRKTPVYSVLGVFGFIGATLLIYSAVEYYTSVEAKAGYIKEVSIPANDTIYLVTNSGFSSENEDETDKRVSVNFDESDIEISLAESGLIQQTQSLGVKKSMFDSSWMELVYSSRGRTKNEALQLSKNLDYNIRIQDSLVLFSEGVFISKNTKWKYPQVKMVLHVPVGKIIILDDGVVKMLNRHRDDEKDYDGNTFMMTEKGLICLNDSEKENKSDVGEDDNKEINIDWSISGDNDSNERVHIITKNKKVIIKNGRKTEIIEKKVGPIHIRRERAIGNENEN